MYETGNIDFNWVGFESGFGGDMTYASNLRQGLQDDFNQRNSLALSGGGQQPSMTNNLGLSISQNGGEALAGAFGIPPEAGGFVGGTLFTVLSSGKKEDTRPGERDETGAGKKPSRVLPRFEFTYKGDKFTIGDWGRHRSFWNPNDTELYTGFLLRRNGEIISDQAVYVWIEDGKLYLQENFQGWNHDVSAGDMYVYLGLPNKNWARVGPGVHNNPKAMNVPGGEIHASSQSDNGGFQRKSGNTGNDEFRLSSSDGEDIDPRNFITLTGPTPPIVGGNKDSLGPKKSESEKEKDDDDEKDNTNLYIGLGVAGFLILLLIIAFK